MYSEVREGGEYTTKTKNTLSKASKNPSASAYSKQRDGGYGKKDEKRNDKKDDKKDEKKKEKKPAFKPMPKPVKKDEKKPVKKDEKKDEKKPKVVKKKKMWAFNERGAKVCVAQNVIILMFCFVCFVSLCL